MHARIRTLLTSLAIALVGLAVGLLLAESLVRLFADQPVLPRFAIDGGFGVRVNQPMVDTRHYVPGEYDVGITTNSVGMRGRREYPVVAPAGVRRVILLGDSFVFGHGVEDDQVVSVALEGMLNGPTTGRPEWQVLNLAVSGFGQAEELLMWREQALEYRPDVVVLFYFDNDIGNNAVSELFALESGGTLARNAPEYLPGSRLQEALFQIGPVRWLFEHSQAWNLVRNQLSAVVQKQLLKRQGLATFDDATSEGVALTRALISQLIREVHAAGAQPVVFVIPNGASMRSNYPLSAEETVAEGAIYLDGRRFLSQADYYRRDSHWNPRGHRLVAEALAHCLLASSDCRGSRELSLGGAGS